MGRTKNFASVIRSKLAANRELAEAIEQESFKTDTAIKVYDARTAAGLTQEQLAKRLRTSQSVISRIEDADYDGHSLTLLKRIAGALGQRLRVEFYPVSATTPRTSARSTASVPRTSRKNKTKPKRVHSHQS